VSDTRDAFGPLLAQLQGDMSALRISMRALTAELRAMQQDMATRSFINARAAETEVLLEASAVAMDRHFDMLNKRLDQTEQSVEERLTRLEAKP
jgi:uncharacterized coiled-coil protein SlyX